MNRYCNKNVPRKKLTKQNLNFCIFTNETLFLFSNNKSYWKYHLLQLEDMNNFDFIIEAPYNW